MKRERRTHSREFKQEAVALVIISQSELPLTDVATGRTVRWVDLPTAEGYVTAPPGSVCYLTGDGDGAYFKKTGTGSTGWIAMA